MEQMLTPQEVADRLQIKIAKVWALCRTSELRHVRLSERCYRIAESDLVQFVEERKS